MLVVTSGTAVSQGREAIRLLVGGGIRVGLAKTKTLRPMPEEEIKNATKHAFESANVSSPDRECAVA